MKQFLLSTAACFNLAYAEIPTNAIIDSCVRDDVRSPTVKIVHLRSGDIFRQEEYLPGYDATFYFGAHGVDIGYAESKSGPALIYGGKLYPITSAQTLSARAGKPSDFTPQLADWSMIRGFGTEYLCVSFNFDGLGRSGSFQQVRGAYLLELSPQAAQRKLYYDVRQFPSKG